MKSWFISDLHLKNHQERNSQILLRFLFRLNENPKDNQLFLLGDIFDFWLSDGQVFEDQFKPIVDEIIKFKKNGGDVYYFEGNHDFHVDVYWTKRYGIPVIENQKYFQMENYVVRLEHGDLINPDDKAYMKYRATVRHPFTEFLAHFLPGFFWKWFGERASAQSRKKSKEYFVKNQDEMRSLIRKHAENVYQEKPFDVIVTGHMHIEDDYEFKRNGKNIRSINLGTWLNRPIALMIESENIQWVPLEGN